MGECVRAGRGEGQSLVAVDWLRGPGRCDGGVLARRRGRLRAAASGTETTVRTAAGRAAARWARRVAFICESDSTRGSRRRSGNRPGRPRGRCGANPASIGLTTPPQAGAIRPANWTRANVERTQTTRRGACSPIAKRERRRRCPLWRRGPDHPDRSALPVGPQWRQTLSVGFRADDVATRERALRPPRLASLPHPPPA
jgi:hypothetical protein